MIIIVVIIQLVLLFLMRCNITNLYEQCLTQDDVLLTLVKIIWKNILDYEGQ